MDGHLNTERLPGVKVLRNPLSHPGACPPAQGRGRERLLSRGHQPLWEDSNDYSFTVTWEKG